MTKQNFDLAGYHNAKEEAERRHDIDFFERTRTCNDGMKAV
jgi:hypothetical protein